MFFIYVNAFEKYIFEEPSKKIKYAHKTAE